MSQSGFTTKNIWLNVIFEEFFMEHGDLTAQSLIAWALISASLFTDCVTEPNNSRHWC